MTLLDDYYKAWQEDMTMKADIDLEKITAVDFFKSQIRKTLDFLPMTVISVISFSG